MSYNSYIWRLRKVFRPLVLVLWSRVLHLVFLIAGWMSSIFTLRNLRPFNSIVVENPNIPNYSFKFICYGPSPLFAEVLINSTSGNIILKLSTQFWKAGRKYNDTMLLCSNFVSACLTGQYLPRPTQIDPELTRAFYYSAVLVDNYIASLHK